LAPFYRFFFIVGGRFVSVVGGIGKGFEVLLEVI
jgi:hypothetical protein